MTFYDSLNQDDSIFNSKLIIIPNNRKNYLGIQRPFIHLTVSDTAIKLLSCLILMRIFYNCPNELHIISCFEKIELPGFHVVSFVCK